MNWNAWHRRVSVAVLKCWESCSSLSCVDYSQPLWLPTESLITTYIPVSWCVIRESAFILNYAEMKWEASITSKGPCSAWKVKGKALSCVRLFASPWRVACTRLLHPWDFLGKSTGVGCHFFLQEIFPTQGSNRDLPHGKQTLYRLSHKGSAYQRQIGMIFSAAILTGPD